MDTEMDELDFYVVPHGMKSGSGDIFGMWDMLVRDRNHQCYYFVQITGNRNNAIRSHELNDVKKYVFSGDWSIRYYLVSYKKRKRSYQFRVEEIIVDREKVIFSKIYDDSEKEAVKHVGKKHK